MRPILLSALLLCAVACTQQPVEPGVLLLNNPHFPPTHVQVVITANPDCASHGAGYVSTTQFILPSNATRVIAVPTGTEACWRRDANPLDPQATGWSPWDRAFVGPGTQIDANL